MLQFDDIFVFVAIPIMPKFSDSFQIQWLTDTNQSRKFSNIVHFLQ